MRTAYADECGDTGYEFSVGSSPLFVLAVVLPREPADMLAGAATEQAGHGDRTWLGLAQPNIVVWWEEKFPASQNKTPLTSL
ncbi:MAG: hypothetical protein HY784_18445 [Chloroflexi bacterium]|nr:hypothetical protein [Chloroflexota bacterium]